MPSSGRRLGISYFGNRYPHHARDDLVAIAGTGADFVVHVMSEGDLRWNPETLAELIAIGRERGLQPWLIPWALGGVFGGESASYAVAEHPAACQRDNHGRHLPALCPRQSVFHTLLETWLDAAVAVGAEVVQWDELHLALPYRGATETWACRCAACQEAFLVRYGEPMPAVLSPTVQAFLDELIADTLAWLVVAARQRGLQSSLVMLADASYDPVQWHAAAALDGVRFFGSTAFWYFYGIPSAEVEPYIAHWARRIREATVDTPAMPVGWVQAFGVPAGREAEIELATRTLVDAGIGAIAVWSYLACVAMSGLAAEDPDATWRAVERAFASVRR